MKKLIYSLTILTLSLGASAQEAGKVKSTVSGKGSVLTVPTDKITLDNFQVTFNLFSSESDQGGGMGSTQTVTVSVRASLNEVKPSLTEEIVNDAYAYFVDQWKKRGVEIVVPTKAELEASKKYSKAASKGEGKIMSGGSNEIAEKNEHKITSYPAGTNIAFSGSKLLPVNGNGAHTAPDFKSNYFWSAFTATVDFMNFKTAKIGSTASVKGTAQITAVPILSLTVWEKAKFGVYSAYQEMEGTTDFYTGNTEDSNSFFNSSANAWNYTVDPVKYKAGVLDLLKKSMDDMFADYDATVAKEKG